MSRMSITPITALFGFFPGLLLLGLGSSAWAGSTCDTLEGATGVNKVTICQPKEYQGSYGVRQWQADMNTICPWIEENKCVTLDNMNCNGDPIKCLKWGSDAYAGQVVLPVGINMLGWGSWSCDGQHRRGFKGTNPAQVEDFWDSHWRIDAFKFFNSENFQCQKDQMGNYALINTCAQKGVKSGRWVYQWSQPATAPTTKLVSVGVENSTSVTNTQNWQKTVSEGFKLGYTLTGDGGEQSGEVNVGSSFSRGGSEAVTNAVKRTHLEQISKTFNGAGSYWQFIANVGSSNNCPARDISTEEFVRTPNYSKPPCCPPGTFENIDNANGACIDPKLKICK
jgi:hypothetical protein